MNPEEKDFSFGEIIANPKPWDRIVSELKKCILLCANCHGEIHNGYASIPLAYREFDESFSEARNDLELRVEGKDVDDCPICGNKKPKVYITCSRSCAAKRSKTVKWDSIDIEKLKREGLSDNKIGLMVGCSGVAAQKRRKK